MDRAQKLMRRSTFRINVHEDSSLQVEGHACMFDFGDFEIVSFDVVYPIQQTFTMHLTSLFGFYLSNIYRSINFAAFCLQCIAPRFLPYPI